MDIGAIKPPARGDLFGQPRGLAWLSGTQFWEAFSLYGLQAMLALYMAGQILQPGRAETVLGLAPVRAAVEAVTGPLSTQAFAAQLFGLWAGLIRFTPIFGGILGDRLLGRRPTIMIGCLLMTAGHFCMAFDASFLIALLLLMLGTGCANANLWSQVGAVYTAGDRRRDSGVQLYYVALNTGAFVAPVICGWLGQELGPHLAFAVAGFGMLIGLLIYALGGRDLPADPPRLADAIQAPLLPAERRIVLLLGLLTIVAAAFWVSQSQVWNVYNLWVRDHVDLKFYGWSMPVPWLQALDALAPILLLPGILALWRRQAGRGTEPDAMTKMIIGCLLMAGSMVWLAAAGPLFGAQVPLLWAVAFHFILNSGWVFFVPITIGLVSRLAPAGLNATMIGAYTASVFIGSTISGRLGGNYESWSGWHFWLLHAGVTAGGALALLLLRPVVRVALADTSSGARG